MSKKITKIIEFLVVLFMILGSKTVYFGVINRNSTEYALIILCIILIFSSGRKIERNTWISFVSLFYVLMIVTALHFSDINTDYIKQVFGLGLLFFEMAIVVTCIDRKVYIKYYINIMVVISIISIVCLLIAVNYTQIVYRIADTVLSGKNIFIISPYYTWGWNSTVFLRNSGPFWEPGAFQGFIFIALLMLLFYKNTIKMYKIKFLILVVTFLTTQSTTGYMILGIMCLGFGSDVLKLLSGKDKGDIPSAPKVLWPIVMIGGILCIYLIMSSGVIKNKFMSDNVSMVTRNNDVTSSLKILFEKPILGYGYGTAKLERENYLGILNNSAGLLSMMYTYGIIFAIVYIYRYKQGLDSMFPFDNKIKRLCLYTIFIVVFLSEGLYWLPAFGIFLYKWPDSNCNIEM